MRNLNIRVVQSVKVPLPRMELQQGLAETIKVFDDAFDSLEHEIESLTVFRSAMLSNLLAGSLAIPIEYDSLVAGVA